MSYLVLAEVFVHHIDLLKAESISSANTQPFRLMLLRLKDLFLQQLNTKLNFNV